MSHGGLVVVAAAAVVLGGGDDNNDVSDGVGERSSLQDNIVLLKVIGITSAASFFESTFNRVMCFTHKDTTPITMKRRVNPG